MIYGLMYYIIICVVLVNLILFCEKFKILFLKVFFWDNLFMDIMNLILCFLNCLLVSYYVKIDWLFFNIRVKLVLKKECEVF